MSWEDNPQTRDVARYVLEGGDPQVLLSDKPYISGVGYARCCKCGKMVDVTFVGIKTVGRLLKEGKFFCSKCKGSERNGTQALKEGGDDDE